MKKKLVSILMCTTLLASLATGCGGASTTSTDTDSEAASSDEVEAEVEPEISTFGDSNGTNIELWTFVAAHANFYGQMAEKWNEEHPDKAIKLTATTYPYGDMHTKLLMSFNAGTGAPDVCDVEIGQFPNVVAGQDDWLYPLNDSAAPYLDNMVPARMQVYAGSDGNYYGAPFHVGATVMYYNLGVLEQYGITKEDIDAIVTWKDYEELGKKYVAAVKEEGKYWTCVDTGGTDWLWLAMAEYGEDWTGGFDGKANVQLQSVSNMLKMQQSWLELGIAQVSPDGQVDLEAGFQNILDHNIVSFPKAMWFMSRFINYMPEEKGNWYIAKCPVFEEGQPCSVGIGGTGTVVTQQSENKELAAEFLCWAKMSKEGEKVIWKELGFDVCNTSLWSDESFAHDESSQYNTFFRNYPYDVLNSIKDEIGKISVVAISPTINDQINLRTLNNILESGADVDEELAAAQEAIELEE